MKEYTGQKDIAREVRLHEELLQYVRNYPDILDRLLALWNIFDLEGLRSFLASLDFTSAYKAPPLTHRRYVECRDLIASLVLDESGYRDNSGDGHHYLNGTGIQKVYSASARAYDSVWDSVWTYEDRKRVVQALDLSPGDTLLEIGIGTGNNLRHIPQDCEVTGIDFSHEMLAVCEDKARRLSRDNVTLIETDAHTLEFENDKFDKALCFYTLCCVTDPHCVLSELERVCKPGGSVVVYDVVRSDIPEVAAVQYVYRPIARELGAVYLEFCPPRCISYDSFLDLGAAMENTGLRLRQKEFVDPFRTATLMVFECAQKP